MIRSDVADCFTVLGGPPPMFEKLEPDVREPSPRVGTIDQTNAEFCFQVCNSAAHSGSRHLKTSCRFRETVCLRDLGKNDQGIEICHDFPISENLIFNFPP